MRTAPTLAEHADFDGIENLALVLGGEITSTFDDASNVKLGSCKLIEEIMIGEDKLIHFSGALAPPLLLRLFFLRAGGKTGAACSCMGRAVGV